MVEEPADALLRDIPCTINFKRGWKCIRAYHHAEGGPCALVPKWWNLRYRRERLRWKYR